MKIVFMGTPDFAIPPLREILNSRHEVAAVVTALDKERGRGKQISFTPVKEFAIEHNIPVLQPEKLKNSNFIDELKKINADVFVVVAFRILPREVFSIPKFGSFNLHGSLLPKYRGAAPIHWAIINGERITGLTTFALDDKVDTGNVYLRKEIEINDSDDLGILYDRMSNAGGEIVLKTLDMIESGNYELLPQDNSLASPAPKITKETGKIDFNKSAEEIKNLIRGLSPVPAAYFINDGKVVKLYKAEVVSGIALTPGEILQTKKELIIGCGKDAIKVLEVQLEGRKRMETEEFNRGYKFK